MNDHSPYFASREEQQKAHADLISHMRSKRSEGTRAILVHLNVEISTDYSQSADDVADDVEHIVRLASRDSDRPAWMNGRHYVAASLADEI